MSVAVVVGGPLVGDPAAFIRARIPDATVDVCSEPRGPDVAVLAERAKHADALLSLFTQRIDDAFLAACPRLRVVANYAVGFDNIDLGACRARGIVVTNTPDALTDATADLAFALMLDVARGVTTGDRSLRAGEWDGYRPHEPLGARVSGATLGVLGLGRIGSAVAMRAKGFAMPVIYAQRRRASAEQEAALGARFVSLEQLLGEADFVSIHAPLTTETRALIGARELRAMKRSAFLINTARGAIVDEEALARALASGVIAGAGLDVFTREPTPVSGLLGLANVVLTPHIGSAERTAREAMAHLACEGICDVLQGRQPRHRVA